MLCRLNHPCITIFKDFHEDWDPPVLVMEYVEGVTLAELLKNEPGPWEVKRSFHILLQMAEALAYCHKAGIIHRDAKPANILITGADHVKVTDFGIARLKDAPSLTQVGVVVGSALVMAPEQWLRRPLDLKVDIYALGVIAYRMLTGRYPFEGSVEELRAGHCEEHAVPPRSLNPDLPPPVSNLIMECLNKDPRLRISSCDEFIRRIRALQPALVIYERYRFEDEIGRGAMGIVYRATRRDDGMTVAIKTLDQRLTDPALLKRLKSEASVLARLNHAFICRLIRANSGSSCRIKSPSRWSVPRRMMFDALACELSVINGPGSAEISIPGTNTTPTAAQPCAHAGRPAVVSWSVSAIAATPASSAKAPRASGGSVPSEVVECM